MNMFTRNVCNVWWKKKNLLFRIGDVIGIYDQIILAELCYVLSLCVKWVFLLYCFCVCDQLFVSNNSFCSVIFFLFLVMQWVVMEEVGELVSCMPLSLLTLHFSSTCFPWWLGRKLKVSLGEVLVSALQLKMGTDEIKINNIKNWVIYNWNCNNKQNLLFLVEKKFTKNGN